MRIMARVRRFLPSTAISYGVVVACVIAVAMVTLLIAGESMVALPATIASFWLVLNAAPVHMSGVELSAQPFALPLLLGGWIAMRLRQQVRERISLNDVRVITGLSLLIPLLLSFTALAMIKDAEPVLPVATPGLWGVVWRTVLLHTVTIAVGFGSRLWTALLRFRGIPTWIVDAIRLAFHFCLAMWTVGAVVVLASLVIRSSQALDAFEIADTKAGVVGLVVLSLLYLPTIAFGAATVVSGAEWHFGAGSISLFSATSSQLPPLPILAAMPEHSPSFGGLGLLIPAAVAVLVVRRFLFSRPLIVSPLGTLAVSAVSAGLMALVTALLTGGRVGFYGDVGADPLLAALSAMLWLGVVGLIVVAVVGFKGLAADKTGAGIEDSDVEENADADTDTDSDIAEGDADVDADTHAEADLDTGDSADDEIVENTYSTPTANALTTEAPADAGDTADTGNSEDEDDTETTESTTSVEDSSDTGLDTEVGSSKTTSKTSDVSDESAGSAQTSVADIAADVEPESGSTTDTSQESDSDSAPTTDTEKH